MCILEGDVYQLNEYKEDAGNHPDVETGDIGDARYRPGKGERKKENLRSLENMEVRVRRMVMAMASLSAMHFGGRKRANQEMAR